MYPTAARPALGSFVRDQVEALRRIGGVELELFTFEAWGSPAAYPRAARELRRAFGKTRFDVVHAHFGLTIWAALGARAHARAVTLHGTDLAHPRSRWITLAGLPFVDLVGAVSEPLAASVPRIAVRPGATRAVLPCGVDLGRFHPIDRERARDRLGLEADGPYLLFAADPARPEKRHDRAAALAERAGGVRLLTLGEVAPEQVPLWVNAANAVLVTSEREGFGLAALEALACNVPVLSTPEGIAPEALNGVAGAWCEPFDLERWASALEPHLTAVDPRIEGRAAADRYSADRMAERVVEAWRAL